MDDLYKYNIIVINLKRLNHSINCVHLYYTIENDKIQYRYATLSSNINSLLSEFYKNLIKIDLEKPLSGDLVKLNKFIENKIEQSNIELNYYEYNKSNTIDVISDIKNKKYNILLLSYLWVFNIDEYINNNINYHENYDLFYILFTSTDEIMRRDISISIKDIFNERLLCQKITPIKEDKFMYYDQLLTKTGKQLIIMNKCNQMIENSVCSNLSKLVTYILIYKTDKDLFNNFSIKNKIIESHKYKSIEETLENVRNEVNEINISDSKAKMRETIILRNLNNIISYINKTILYSNYSISFISEYCGMTLFDFIKDKDTYNIKKDLIGDIFHEMKDFDNFMFQILYTLYCLNLSGIINSDLHLNNITIEYMNEPTKNIYYDISDSNDISNVYNLKDIKCKPYIIDFDRSYVLIDKFPINYEKHRDLYITYEKKRFDKQIEELLNNTKMKDRYHFKKFYKREYFSKFFLYYSAYDINSLVSNILALIDKEKLDVDRAIENKLQNIFSYSFKYIEDILFDRLDEENINEYPNYSIINEFFKEYRFNNVLTKQIEKNNEFYQISGLNSDQFLNDIIKKNKLPINDLIINNSSSAA